MRNDSKTAQLEFEGFGKRLVVAGFDGGPITSDAGRRLLRETDWAADRWGINVALGSI